MICLFVTFIIIINLFSFITDILKLITLSLDFFLDFFTRALLPQGYTYLIKNFNELPPYQTSENFSIPQFELDTFVDINDKEKAQEWFKVFESHTKTMMSQFKGYEVKGNQVLFREKCHCIHSNKVKEKQGNCETKLLQSS